MAKQIAGSKMWGSLSPFWCVSKLHLIVVVRTAIWVNIGVGRICQNGILGELYWYKFQGRV